MTKKRFTKEEFEGCPRFIPFKRNERLYYDEFPMDISLFDIVDTEKLDYVDFIMPYQNVKECERDCNIMNVVDYLLKEIKE